VGDGPVVAGGVGSRVNGRVKLPGSVDIDLTIGGVRISPMIWEVSKVGRSYTNRAATAMADPELLSRLSV
jgi:hypothetical protein